jgi:hypothetical protein
MYWKRMRRDCLRVKSVFLEVPITMRSFRRGQRWLLAGIMLVLVLPVRAADVDKYLPGDAEFVAQINFKQILDSPVVKKHALDKLKEKLKQHDEAVKILDSLGFDPFKDLTSITLAGNGLETDSKPFIIAHGIFDLAKFEAKAEEVAKNMPDSLKIHKEGDHKIYEVKVESGGDDKPTFVGLIDKTTIVVANDKDYILESFARAEGKKKGTVKKEVQDLIEKTDGKQSVWVVIPANLLGKNPLAQQDEETKKLVDKMDSFSLGLSVEKDVKLAITIASKSAENAKQLADDLKNKVEQGKNALTLFAGQIPQLAPFVDVLGNAKADTEGKTVTLKIEVSEEVIEKALKP